MRQDNILSDKQILLEEKARIERRIKAKKLPNYKVESVGGYIADDEIFVQYPGRTGYYISNYNRVISTKRNRVALMKPQKDKNGYLYILTCKKGHVKKLWIQRGMAEVFCPNIFKDVLEKNGKPIKVQAHHLNHRKDQNYPENLIFIPSYLHVICNYISRFGIFRTKTAKVLHPLDIVEKTGLNLADIILCARKRPVKQVGKWTIFDVRGCMIALDFLPSFYESGFAFKEEKSA